MKADVKRLIRKLKELGIETVIVVVIVLCANNF